jgi:serine/threonine-protein kinase
VTHRCPACQQTFVEPGFCPFDGTPLEEVHATVVSAQVRAQSDAESVATTPDVRAVSAAASATNALAHLRKLSEYDRLVGETLDGRYYVERKIGEGGMGVVFAVKHTVIERPLAIKVLRREVMRDEATLRRFVQEAKAASRIGHPNIVDVTDFGKTPDGMTYSVMEYVEGTTLAKAIKHGAPFTADRAIHIAMQLARALAAAHDKGIVHRDLKPENVFLTDREGRPDFVKIVDFGIAKVQPVDGTMEQARRLTRDGAVFGTPEYMAPEQAAGRADTDRRVDIYALGTILYEMVVGRVPHKGHSMVRTIAMQMLEPITPPRQVAPGVSSGLETVIMKALAKDRDERYATMGELIAALEGVVSSEPRSLPPVPPGTDNEAPPQRRTKGETRPLHEPEFVAAPLTSDPAFDEPPLAPPRRRWPMLLAGLVVLAVGAGAAIVIIGRIQRDPVAQADAAVIARAPADSAAVIVAPVDAEPPAADAATIVLAPADAGPRAVRDAGTVGPVTSDSRHPSGVRVTVYVRPGDAEIYARGEYRGPASTTLEEPYGTKLTVECKTANMKGSTEIVFDGKRANVMCTATRQRYCVDGIKNPFDDCEQRPGN